MPTPFVEIVRSERNSTEFAQDSQHAEAQMIRHIANVLGDETRTLNNVDFTAGLYALGRVDDAQAQL
jgi:hypothetical protein